MKNRAGKMILAAVFSLSLFMGARAQVQIEEEVSTDTVDMFAKSETTEKSSALAAWANLLLPGLGNLYRGDQAGALGYFAVEAALMFGAFTTSQYSTELANSAHSFAATYADIRGGVGADEYFWQNVGQFMDSDGLNQSRSIGFNQIQELNRTPGAEYLTSNLQWRWVSDQYRQQYNHYLNTSINYKVASNFFFGAMILDRLIAFVDARVASRHNGRGIFASLHVTPQYSPQTGHGGLLVSSEF